MKLVPINSAEFFPNILLKSLYSFVLICSCLSPVSPLFPSLPAVEGKTHGSIFCRRGWRTWPDCSLPAVSPGLCFPSNPTTSRSLWGAGKTPFPSAPWTNMCGCCYPVSGLCANTTVTLPSASLPCDAQTGQSHSRRACGQKSVHVLPVPGQAGLRDRGVPWTHRRSSLTEDSAMAPRGPPVTPPHLLLSHRPLTLVNAQDDSVWLDQDPPTATKR